MNVASIEGIWTGIGGGTFFKGGHKSTSKTMEHFCGLAWQLWRHKHWNV